MGPEILLIYLTIAGIGVGGVKGLFAIAQKIGIFQGSIMEVIKHHDKRLDRLDSVTDDHDKRIREGGL